MSIKKQIQINDWQDRVQSLTSGNKGRSASLRADGNILAERKAFEYLVYDPVNKGNSMTIAVDGYAHTVEAPNELMIEEQDNGTLEAIIVINEKGEKTVLSLH